MNDRHYPDEEEVEHTGDRDPQPSGGGLTSATGALTPDATGTEPFIPAERREIEDPIQGARMTEAMAVHAQAQTNLPSEERVDPDGPVPTPRTSGPRPAGTDEYTDGEEHY
jgi:hypothetical protein